MKMVKTIEVEVCDKCKKDNAYNPCRECGAVYCYDCNSSMGVLYRHGVYFRGSGDGFYCFECIKNPNKKNSNLFKAYAGIQFLRESLNQFNEIFEATRKADEENLKSELRKAGL